MPQIPPSNAAPRIAELMRELLGFPHVASLVAGEAMAGDGAAIQLHDPATGEKTESYADAGPAVIAAAHEAAARAQAEWWGKTASERGRILWNVARLVREKAPLLAELEALSAGRLIRDIAGEAVRIAEMFEYYAGWADKLHGEVIPVPTSHLNYTRPEPYGTVVQITPWNAPLFTCGWQVAPAICAGNAVVIKPSELSPHSTLVVARLVELAGAPKGLVNVIAGAGPTAGQGAIEHPGTRLVVFVGSALAGARIAGAAARNLVPCILELGGKSANIIFDDADIHRAIPGAQAAIFGGAGQSCVAGSRILVHRAIHERFVDLYGRATATIPVGAPMDRAALMGPINNLRQYEKIQGMVRTALEQGGRLVTGGAKPAHLADSDGYFYAPTVIDGIRPGMEIATEEVFGPVVGVTAFDSEEEAVALANATPYGLAGAVWTQDVGRAHRVAARVRAGTFWINSYKTINVMSPFGGFGKSGYGRSSGREALAAYSVTKSVWVETSQTPTMTFSYSPE
ncbi:aldehyde dehydrogenase family protein [Pseudogemmobacter sonorensis]|uniref:aldehyde dehydrogenase family protein n=1 Tax=Pseudogemmobacter sonorensis TaxID=2989681 RepID=UPI00367F2019